MRMIHILEPFTGYPSGKKRDFEKGDEPEVPNDFADLVVGKGHAREMVPAEPEQKPEAGKRGRA